MRFLLDAHIPRTLAPELTKLGHDVEDVRDIGLRGQPDSELFERARTTGAIIVTRDRGFSMVSNWPRGFWSGVIFVNLPDTTPVSEVISRVVMLVSTRLPVSLEGAITIVESRQALSRTVRKRPRPSAASNADDP